jgi:hypothetical protein
MNRAAGWRHERRPHVAARVLGHGHAGRRGDDPASAAVALVAGLKLVLTRAGLPVGRRTLDAGMARAVLRRARDTEYAQNPERSPSAVKRARHWCSPAE